MAYLVKPIKQADLEPAIGIAMRRFEQFQALRKETADLKQALEDRKVIEKAKGILMKKAGLDEHDAFRRLQKLASDKNRKLIEIAQMILTAEEALEPPGAVLTGSCDRPIRGAMPEPEAIPMELAAIDRGPLRPVGLSPSRRCGRGAPDAHLGRLPGGLAGLQDQEAGRPGLRRLQHPRAAAALLRGGSPLEPPAGAGRLSRRRPRDPGGGIRSAWRAPARSSNGR